MAESLLTPSTITAWLDCAHYVTLRHEVELGTRARPRSTFGELAQILLDKGMGHEEAVLARYRAAGRSVYEVPARGERETFEQWVHRLGDVLAEGHDVVYQLPFVHEGIRGVADFLERAQGPDGVMTYEPVDAKLARAGAKPGHVLQLCFYAEAIAAQTGRSPVQAHLALGSGVRESIRLEEVLPYWRRLRGRLATVVTDPSGQATRPDPCAHCAFCEFSPVCDAQWRAADSLVHVPGVQRTDRDRLAASGVDTIAALAAVVEPLADLVPERLGRMVGQASLQVQAREGDGGGPPPFRLLRNRPSARSGAPEPALTGFAALPRPAEGDVFLDFEGHPFWRPEMGLFFLLGLIEHLDQHWEYRAFWAHDQPEEAAAVQDLVRHLTTRRQRFPDMHVYHYNHTERSSLERLVDEYGVAEADLTHLVDSGAFVDLYPIVTGAVQIGTESYGLKHVERLTDYERSHDIDQGAGAVVDYDRWTRDGEPRRLERIARYNEDDVRATRAVRDWLVEHRPEDAAWRPAVLEPRAPDIELEERIERLHAFGPDTPQHLMGDLLGYWRRERAVVAADCLRQSVARPAEQLEAPGTIAGLTLAGFETRYTARGTERKWPSAVLTFPEQPIHHDVKPGSTMIVALSEQEWVFFTLDRIDRDARTLEITWNQARLDRGLVPGSLVHYGWINEAPKPAALATVADGLLSGPADAVGHAILRRDPTTFLPGQAPGPDGLVGDLSDICRWAGALDASYLPIQGPPGTGKTFTGAHIVRTLVRQGKRVGITAMSHPAIDNLTRAVVERFAEDGVELRAVRKSPRATVDGVAHATANRGCATGEYDVIGGTPWLFASEQMREHPVDVLVVDEAGQLGLADTLAATASATNVILLGDPQQLPQVAQAGHPHGAGASVLEHLLGTSARTFPPDRGVLLETTWRMHPEVGTFISEVMYEGRLRSRETCLGQTTAAGTGLRWIPAEHTERSTDSPEEAAIVHDVVAELIGSDWTDQNGRTAPLTPADIIVVTPYNDQRRLLSSTLQRDPATARVEVGTVDKFQGREAAVVLYSMATSSASSMPREADFLFSKNRLNVAVSRARCLAYLVCTDELLDTRARDVEQMSLISALCAFVERAELVAQSPRTTS